VSVLPILALAGSACAQGVLGSDGGSSDQGRAEVTHDLRERDLVPEPDPDVEDLVHLPDESIAEDISTVDLIGECNPFSVFCSEDGYSVVRCSARGELFAPRECLADEVCQQHDSIAECLPCTTGIDCRPDAQVCDPGVNFCLDFQTAASCNEAGQVGTTASCGAGRCFRGGCSSVGNDTGEACPNNAGCKGRFCLCGTEDTTNDDTSLCTGNMTPGYCTTSGCDISGCDPDSEVCADFLLSGAFGGGRYCLLQEDCTGRLGPCNAGHRGDSHVCRALPVTDASDRRTWDYACWVPPPADSASACRNNNCISSLGDPCTGSTDCIGGLCLTLDDSIRYCSATCDETHACPDYASCVRIQEGSDSHFCLANATTSDCPRMLIETFNIVARSFTELGGTSVAQVCFVRD
jgi:hypothetical protein